jgi:spore coat-associated protein N
MIGSASGRRSRREKLVLTLALLLMCGAVASFGAFALFTTSASATHTVSSGTVEIELGATGASTNRLNVDATGIVPGDTIQRGVDLINDGEALSSITLTTSANPTSLLDADAVNGLQMVIERCSTAWTEGGAAPAYTYTCAGTTSTVVATRAVVGTNLALANLTTPDGGGLTDHLRVTLSFPTTAGNTFQGLSSTITYTFTGTQRAGTDR